MRAKSLSLWAEVEDSYRRADLADDARKQAGFDGSRHKHLERYENRMRGSHGPCATCVREARSRPSVSREISNQCVKQKCSQRARMRWLREVEVGFQMSYRRATAASLRYREAANTEVRESQRMSEEDWRSKSTASRTTYNVYYGKYDQRRLCAGDRRRLDRRVLQSELRVHAPRLR